MEKPGGQARHQLEMRLGALLRLGVALAAAVVLSGGVLYLSRHGMDHPAYHTFHSGPSSLRTLPGILEGALHLREREVIQFGLVLLIATPIARVAFSIFAFCHERDWMYAGISAIVLALLLYGLTSAA
ncbi:MAG: DUF1634 domain-containing protein [Bryobacterales bacterium]|nr:DUF1634 domain-containing protein [Bryobacterales bacterium]